MVQSLWRTGNASMVETALGRAFSDQLPNELKVGQAYLGSSIYHTVSGNPGYAPLNKTQHAPVVEPVEIALGRAFSRQIPSEPRFGQASSSSGMYHTVSGSPGYVPVYQTQNASMTETALGRAFSNELKIGQASFVTESRGQVLNHLTHDANNRFIERHSPVGGQLYSHRRI